MRLSQFCSILRIRFLSLTLLICGLSACTGVQTAEDSIWNLSLEETSLSASCISIAAEDEMMCHDAGWWGQGATTLCADQDMFLTEISLEEPCPSGTDYRSAALTCCFADDPAPPPIGPFPGVFDTKKK